MTASPSAHTESTMRCCYVADDWQQPCPLASPCASMHHHVMLPASPFAKLKIAQAYLLPRIAEAWLYEPLALGHLSQLPNRRACGRVGKIDLSAHEPVCPPGPLSRSKCRFRKALKLDRSIVFPAPLSACCVSGCSEAPFLAVSTVRAVPEGPVDCCLGLC